MQQSGLEGTSCLTAIPTELGEDRAAALVVASDWASPGVCHEALSSKSAVSVFMSPELKAA